MEFLGYSNCQLTFSSVKVGSWPSQLLRFSVDVFSYWFSSWIFLVIANMYSLLTYWTLRWTFLVIGILCEPSHLLQFPVHLNRCWGSSWTFWTTNVHRRPSRVLRFSVDLLPYWRPDQSVDNIKVKGYCPWQLTPAWISRKGNCPNNIWHLKSWQLILLKDRVTDVLNHQLTLW